MKFRSTQALTLGMMAAAVVTTAQAQQAFDPAKDDYDSHCAACQVQLAKATVHMRLP
jgi:hypothetical protein